MPYLLLDKKEIELILNKLANSNVVFEQNLTIYLKSVLSASDKPSWVSDPDSSSISKLLEDNSNL